MVIATELTRELRALEEVVVDFVLNPSAKLQYQQGNIAKKELAPYVQILKDMSSRYVEVENVKLSRLQVEAYALYYLPINFSKIAYLLDQNVSFSASRAVRVFDFGCGPGTGSLAAAYSVKRPTEISLWDASKECISFATKLLSLYSKESTIKSLPGPAPQAGQFYDLVIAANVISEIPEPEREATLELLIQQVDVSGYLVLLVPALKSTTQVLMAARDRILANHRELSIIFPCSIQSPCPMLAEDHDDWCHGELLQSSWQRTALLKQFDEMLGFNKHRVKYACMIFQRSAAPAYKGLRILRPFAKSHPALLCGNEGLKRIDVRAIENPKAKRALKKGNSYHLIDPDDVV